MAQAPTLNKQRNYSIDFYRMVFCSSFAFIHVFQVAPMMRGNPPAFTFCLDTLLPFCVFSGFFQMQSFRAKKARAELEGRALPAPSIQAAQFLWSRFKSLWPLYLIGCLMGFATMALRLQMSVGQLLLALLNAIPELLGIHITGMGMGNESVGHLIMAAGAELGNASTLVMNDPLWFISAMFIGSYVVYYLLARCENLFLAIIVPLGFMIWTGSANITSGQPPMWLYWQRLGTFYINDGLLQLTLYTGIGCLLWVAVDRLKQVDFTKGFRVFLTVVNAAASIFMIYRTWTPVDCSIGIRLSFSTTYLIGILSSFLLLLNKDGFTKLLNRKIWDLPGKLALYFYAIHFPLVTILSLFIENLTILFLAVLVSAWALAYVVYLLDTKVIQPWINKLKIIEPKAVEAKG